MIKEMTKKIFTTEIYDLDGKEPSYKGKLPSVIKFHAPWCGPCKVLEPIMEDISKDYNGKVNFYSVNIDDEMEIATMFRIMSVPSTIIIPDNGDAPKSVLGSLDKDIIKSYIDETLFNKEKSTKTIVSEVMNAINKVREMINKKN